MKMKKKSEKNIENSIGIDAAFWSPDRHFNLWPSLNPQDEVSGWKLERIWKRARSLYANCPEIKNAVDTMTLLVGHLMPLPQTSSEEWNNKARQAFNRIALNPSLFESSGRLNFLQAQDWLEKRAIIDGDALIVLRKGALKNGAIQLYAAPQINNDDDPTKTDGHRNGVILGKGGKIEKFLIRNFTDNKSTPIPAQNAILFSHHPDPANPRTPSELLACITTAQDIYEVNSLNKTMLKIQSKFGLIETKDINDKRPVVNDIPTGRNKKSQSNAPCVQEEPLIIDGVKAITLEPGRDLKTLHTQNPSNEVRAFIEQLVHSLAYAVGLDSQILFNPETLGSASTRFILAKAKDWANKRNEDKKVVCNRIYQWVIASEIEAGRLEPCPYADETYNVQWLNKTAWSIDNGRDINSTIALIEAGLMDADTYSLQICGLTRKQILQKKAEFLSDAMEVAKEYGVPINALIEAKSGAVESIDWNETSNEDKTSEDMEPETSNL